MKFLLVAFYAYFFAGYVTANEAVYTVDTTASQLIWHGKKAFIQAGHTGTLKIKKGTLVVIDGNKLKEADFTVDFNTLTVTDDMAPKYKKKLTDHLKSKDFFYTEKFPTSSLTVNEFKINGNKNPATGTLTMRGISKKVNMEAKDIKIQPKIIKATVDLKFNRHDFDVNYNSEASWTKKVITIAKDKVIADEVKVEAKIVGRLIKK